METQKLKERRRGKTVSRGFKSSMVTISFFPRLACLLIRKNINVNYAKENKIVNSKKFELLTLSLNTLGKSAASDCSYCTRSP